MSNRNFQAPPATFHGLPTGSGIGIVFAALFTGVLLSLSAGVISWPLLALYAAAVILVATLVNPKGLFLNVAAAPLLFVVAVVVAGYIMSADSISGGSSGKAAHLLAFYPVAEFFPVLFTVTAGSIAIAAVRIWLIERRNKAIREYETAERSRQNASNRRTNTQGRRARERTQAVPVQELLARVSTEKREKPDKRGSRGSGSTRVVNRLGDDLYQS